MATSGSYGYSVTAGQIIQAAYEDLGMVSPGQSASTADIAMALARLNMIVKQYQGNADGSPGMKIHTRQRIELLIANSQHIYLIGPGTSEDKASPFMGRTTLTANVAKFDTVLPITASMDKSNVFGRWIDMVVGSFIGIELDDATIQGSTIATYDATSVTLSTPLRSAASVGKLVRWYDDADRAQRFPVLESAVLRSARMEDSPLDIYTELLQYEYGVSKKIADGTPTALLFEPLRTQSRITLDSRPTDVTQTIVLTVLYPSEDYDSVSNDIAYPQEALRFLSWELAFALGPSYGKWTKEMEMNRQEARAMYMTLNPETTVLHFLCGGE